VELPVNPVVKVPLGGGSGLFFHGGPYAAMGVFGKSSGKQK
jgi:hypothetical protein